MIKLKTLSKRDRARRSDRILVIFALATLLIAYIAGSILQDTDFVPALKQALPEAEHFEELTENTFAAYNGDTIIGYVAIGEAIGYSGPIQLAVALDNDGLLLGTAVVDHKETPLFFKRVSQSHFFESLVGKKYDDSFVLGQDVDRVTGATYSSQALVEAAIEASQVVAGQQLGLPISERESPAIQFGVPEITLVLLYAGAYIGHRPRFKFKKQLRWVTLLTGMIVLGFLYNIPLTIARINSLLLGFWPAWQSNLYWYMLIFGLFLIATVDNKNAYCAWFCPFGAAQECMAVIGGAKYNTPRKYRRTLLWVIRGLAWLAILLAFLFRNPGLSSYEVFGTLFDFTGSTVMFALLVIVLLVSLFVRRPWCNYLCPLDPIFSVIRLIRTWVLELWQKTRQRVAALSS